MNSKIILLLITLTEIFIKFVICNNGARIFNQPLNMTMTLLNKRKEFLQNEKDQSLGETIEINPWEESVDQALLEAKNDVYADYFKSSKNIFEIINRMSTTFLFNMIEKMPKGCALNINLYSLCSTDYLLSLTYKDNLWQTINKRNQLIFKFSIKQPEPINGQIYTKVSKIRKKRGAKIYDDFLKKLLTLRTDDPVKNRDTDTVSQRLNVILNLVEPLIMYYPNFKEYFNTGLTEFHADGIQYIEFRGPLAEVYDLTGKMYSSVVTVEIFKLLTDKFISKNPSFYGCKFIYAPMRNVINDSDIDGYIETMKSIKTTFPDFVAGLDLTGEENFGRPLNDFYRLFSILKGVDLFLKAGETNWYGMASDENLIDAILLNSTKRIGHGLAILKHPKVLEIIKEKEIAIEINPISNQVFKFVTDIRNHPAAVLVAGDYPIVISSDAPSFWGVKPLTHDFFQAFMGISSKKHGIKFLQKLATNSIKFSALTEDEKNFLYTDFFSKWHDWINALFEENDYSISIPDCEVSQEPYIANEVLV